MIEYLVLPALKGSMLWYVSFIPLIDWHKRH